MQALKFAAFTAAICFAILLTPFAYFSVLPVGNASLSGSTIPAQRSNNSTIPLNSDGYYSYKLTVIIHNSDLFANTTMLKQGYSPDCRAYCFDGITYTLDPTVVITNNGRDFEQCKVFNASGTITCAPGAADKAIFMGISSATGTISASNTTCSGMITSGGLNNIKGTVTAGTSGTTVTTLISHTWTAAETDTAIQVSCLNTELSGGGNVVLYAIGAFGPDTLTTGNEITLVWSVSRT